MIRHTVILKFRPEITAADRQALMDELSALRGHLSGILGFQVFENISVEDPVVHGFRHGFWFDFADVSARNAYLEDAAHRVAGARLVAACQGGTEGLVVIDVAM